MKKIYALSMVSSLLFTGCSEPTKEVSQIQIEIGPDIEEGFYDDDFDETAFQVWIGPGFYYGVWFDSPFVYRDYCRRRYYYDRHRDGHHGGHHRDGEHHRGHGGGHRH